MKKIQFSTPYEGQVEVTFNGERYGFLEFDHEKNAWILWPLSIDDGISYFEDLEETEETITDEIEDYDEE